MPGCPVAFSDGEALWQQIRAELRGGQLRRGGRVASAHVVRRWQVINGIGRADSARVEIRDEPLMPNSPTPAELFAHGFVTKTAYSREFLAPNDQFFLDDAFTANYCISAGLGGGTGESSLLSVRFAPRTKRRDGSDIRGEFLVDTVKARLEMMRYEYLDLPDVTIERPSGAVVYERLNDGSAFPGSWSQGVPMPTLSGYRNLGDPAIDTVRRVFMRATTLWANSRVDSVTWADGVTYRADSAVRARLASYRSDAGRGGTPFAVDSNPVRPLWGMIRERAHFHPEMPYLVFSGVNVAALPSGRTVRTGDGGAYGFDELPVNDTALVMYRPGFLPGSVRIRNPPGRVDATLESVTASQPANVQTEASHDGMSRVVGAIGDTTLRPVIGARVRLVGIESSAMTDDRGRFSIDAQPGTYLMVVAHPDHAQQIVGVTVRANFNSDVSVWMVPNVQAGEVVSDQALLEFAQRRGEANAARRLLGRDAFGTVGATLLTVRSVMSLARSQRSLCRVHIEGGESVALPAEWLRPIDVELLEIEPATASQATCGNALVRAWIRR